MDHTIQIPSEWMFETVVESLGLRQVVVGEGGQLPVAAEHLQRETSEAAGEKEREGIVMIVVGLLFCLFLIRKKKEREA